MGDRAGLSRVELRVESFVRERAEIERPEQRKVEVKVAFGPELK